ncbi:hypothetical protein OPV22_017827 [Ensete ventricosum]|uniref:Uncharacterized protein n=1 Tax=Ensete ventricosum TaxID=4639 RepID=A0AAV8QSX9_ENSVE|nr:hypothetical protein OPV22_017827 [Ensete ventricosum]
MEVNPRIGSGDEMSKRSESEGGGILLGWGTREPLFCLVSFHSPPPIYTMWALLLYASIPASSGVIYLTEESEHTAAWVSPGCRRCCVLASLSVIPVSLAVPGVDDGDLVKEATLRGYIDGGSDWTLVRELEKLELMDRGSINCNNRVAPFTLELSGHLSLLVASLEIFFAPASKPPLTWFMQWRFWFLGSQLLARIKFSYCLRF